MHWTGGWHMGWMSMWWLLIIAVLVLVAWFARSAASRNDGTQQESPEQVLKRRYARGEVDRATYEKMLEDLRK